MSWLGVLVCGLVWAFIVERVTGRTSVVGTRRMMGSRGVVFSAYKTAKNANTHQFFDFIRECFTVLCSMAMVAVIATIFGHVCVGGVVILHGGGMRSAYKTSSRRRDLATFRGAYMVKRGCRSSRGLGSGREGCGVGLAVKGA